ncbi:hypothetical protein [Streptomyces hokutonensis]
MDLAKEFTDSGPLGEDLGWVALSASSAFSARSRQIALLWSFWSASI